MSKDGKWGLFDDTGKQITQVEYSDISQLDSGLYVVTYKRKKGLIDKTGKLLIPCEWKEINLTYRKDSDPVQIKADGKDTTAFFDRQGNRVEV